MENRDIAATPTGTKVPGRITPDRPWVTALFTDRQQAEQAYQALAARGYDVQDINLVMSDDTRKKYFATSERDTELGSKAAEGATAGAAIGGTVGAIAAAIAAVGSAAATSSTTEPPR